MALIRTDWCCLEKVAAGAAIIIYLLPPLLPWPLMIFLIPVSFYSSLPLPSPITLINAFKSSNATIFNQFNLSKLFKKIILIQLCGIQIPKWHNLKLTAAHQTQFATINLNNALILEVFYLLILKMKVKTFQS